MKFKYITNFISNDEASEILQLGSQFKPSNTEIKNDHIKKVAEGTNGFSVLCDLTNTDISQTVAKFQGDATTINSVPDLFHSLSSRISETVGISKDNVFCQYIVLGAGGKVAKHYDAGMPGYVTYKCNICISGPETDELFVDKSTYELSLNALYCFEANFYKHWMEVNSSPRVLLSYGFIVPLEELGYTESDSRVRLSNRIWKAFISNSQ